MNTYKFKPMQITEQRTVYVQLERLGDFLAGYFHVENDKKDAFLAQAIAEGWVKN